ATPLYIIAHADYWRTTGDVEFLKANWDSIQKAYHFSEATDTDGNFLIENTKFGHGWVEGGPLRPVHEEIYMQGLWVEASRSMSELAEVMKDSATVERARSHAERTRAAMEQTYWLSNRGFYAFGTRPPSPPAEKPEAEPGPNRAVRQARMEELAQAHLIDEDTVLPAVPLWWRTMLDERAQSELDHLGSGQLATDWGARIISNQSKLYDPLSYHYGSVWPLFTGWASMGAYRYGRPHVGYQALMANALLTYTNALGYVTELLSGDFNAPFGRSSHHQVWSEAMVVTPALRGLFGIEITAGGRELRFAPQLPANWDRIEAQNVAARDARYDLKLVRAAGRLTITIMQRDAAKNDSAAVERFTLAPAFPLDARVRKVKVQGRAAKFELKSSGDVQRAEVVVEAGERAVEVVFTYAEGTDVYLVPPALVPAAQSEGLRVLRSRADREALHLLLEGLGGRTYQLRVRTPYRLGQADGVTLKADDNSDPQLLIAFAGPPGSYVRREITIPLAR
ncbi:MAG TPA: GH116 family glycosyl hydrolase, partial [Pyrinomonadaceae bacterium]|nr:GH116 family glycosyl hydrolase [Pyrinomonadaceae bacterium]